MAFLNPMMKTIAVFALCAVMFAQNAYADVSFAEKLSHAAIDRTQYQVRYDGSYHAIKYPGGDVPADIGVCSDVVVRSYRAVGIDLQRVVHEDMQKNFALYPKKWGLKRPDSNIDHRRVPNLQVFFTRYGRTLPISEDPAAYQAGDIVTWNLTTGGDLPHIGIVTDRKLATGTPLIVHNIGRGPQLEDMLFDYKITGHYRYDGS